MCADVEQVYVHVHKNNRAAQDLYQKMGFKVIILITVFLVLFCLA